MTKEYTYPEEEPQMVSEPTVAINFHARTHHVDINHFEEDGFDDNSAPCQYSLDEVKAILLNNREEFKIGHYHTMADVNRIMDNWC